LVAVVAVICAGAFLFLRHRQPAAASPPAEAQVGALTEALVSTQVELAKRDLDDKNYAGAAAQAEQALKLAPTNAEALRVKTAAAESLRNLDAAATEAKARFDAGDMDAASAALGRVLALDPKHPVATELSARLNQFFQDQAEQARRDASRARDQAEHAQATTADGFAQATAAVRDAESLLSKGQYAVATQGFLEARDAFDRARRAAMAQAREATKAAQATAAPTTNGASRSQAGSAPPQTTPPAAPQVPSAEEPAKSVSLLPQRKAFVSGETVIRYASTKKGPAGFDTQDVNVNPDFLCRIRFDATPAAVRAAEGYNLKVILVNEGDKTIKIRDLTLATTSNGTRSTTPATPQTREVPGKQSAVLTEVNGAFEESVSSWSLEAAVSSGKGDVCRNQVAWK
jgi:tetratricopeptide (TPR) repeat protein